MTQVRNRINTASKVGAGEAKQQYDVVGQPVPQIDFVEKVTGKLQFSGDISMPGVLHAKVLRSPHAHAKIVNIDTSAAEALPGVEAVITYKDCPEKERWDPGLNWQGQVIGQIVRFVGDEVAAV